MQVILLLALMICRIIQMEISLCQKMAINQTYIAGTYLGGSALEDNMMGLNVDEIEVPIFLLPPMHYKPLI